MPDPSILIDDAAVKRVLQSRAYAALSSSMSVSMMNEDPVGEDGEDNIPDQEVRIVKLSVRPRARMKNEGELHADEADCSVTFELLQGPGETMESMIADAQAVMKVAAAFDEQTFTDGEHRFQFERAERDYLSGEINDAKATLSKVTVPFEVIRNSGTGLE